MPSNPINAPLTHKDALDHFAINEAGDVVWTKAPRHGRNSTGVPNVVAGSLAGTVSTSGPRRVTFKGKRFSVNALRHFILTGRWLRKGTYATSKRYAKALERHS